MDCKLIFGDDDNNFFFCLTRKCLALMLISMEE